MQIRLELAPGQTHQARRAAGGMWRGEEEARQLVAKYRATDAAVAALDDAARVWRDRLGLISVKTPEPTFDLMVNGWTLYQALSCRMWARAALYQWSGAYGFRDQLQDVMAFAYSEPALAREHILRSASRQFEEGDVQHWWHPQSGKEFVPGSRTILSGFRTSSIIT